MDRSSYCYCRIGFWRKNNKRFGERKNLQVQQRQAFPAAESSGYTPHHIMKIMVSKENCVEIQAEAYGLGTSLQTFHASSFEFQQLGVIDSCLGIPGMPCLYPQVDQ